MQNIARTTREVELRTSPVVSDNVILILPQHRNVNVLNSDATWTQVRYRDEVGYCETQYLDNTEQRLLLLEVKVQKLEFQIELLNRKLSQ